MIVEIETHYLILAVTVFSAAVNVIRLIMECRRVDRLPMVERLLEQQRAEAFA